MDDRDLPAGPNHEDERGEGGSLTRRLMDIGADVMNRALVTGVSAVFMTEEGIRNVVSDMRLPKDVARGLIHQADATKNEMFRIIGREVRTFLEQSNMSAAIARALADTTVEIRTTVRFRPNDEGGVTPEVSSVYGVSEGAGTLGEDGGPAGERAQDDPVEAGHGGVGAEATAPDGPADPDEPETEPD